MDLEEVTKQISEFKLSRTNTPAPTIVLDDEEIRAGKQFTENCLVAKVLSPKMINCATFQQQMPRILQATRQIEIGSLGNNIFLLDFKSVQDKTRAMKGGPWNYFKDLVIFCEPCEMLNPKVMTFDKISIWVQYYNLPLFVMNKETLKKVGSQIGIVEEVETQNNGLAMTSFARIRTRIDVTQPLKRFVCISTPHQDEDTIIPLAYERLPDFCYSCGCIGHSLRDCTLPVETEGQLNYGSWLKAPNMGGWDKNRQFSPHKPSSSRAEPLPTNNTSVPSEDIVINFGMVTDIEKMLLKNSDPNKTVMHDGGDKQIVKRLDIPTDSITEDRCWIPESKKWKRRAREKGSKDQQNAINCFNIAENQESPLHTNNSSISRKRSQGESEHINTQDSTAVVAKQPRRSL